MSLYSVAAGLAVDCVRQAQPALVHALVDCLGEFVRKTLATWLRRRGGWVRAPGAGGRGRAGGRGSRLGLHPCLKADPGRARPPELSLLPCPLGGQSHVPPLSLDPPSPAQRWPGQGLLGAVPSL